MARADLLDANLPIITSIVDNVVRYAPEAMLLVVANPVDVLTFHAWRRSGWERRRVFGLSGVLDSTPMARFVALETGPSVKDVTALVLGRHGDARVPLPRCTRVNGIPVDRFLDPDRTARGVETVLELTLSEAEQAALARSAAQLRVGSGKRSARVAWHGVCCLRAHPQTRPRR